MPELYSIGLGGGSKVVFDDSNSSVRIGPVSVGCGLTTEAQSCGGDVLTATDIAVKAGLLKDFGDSAKVKTTEDQVTKAVQRIKAMVEEAIDRIKISAEDTPLIVVGGGAVLLDPKEALLGISRAIFPKNYQVANAVGAALAQVSGNFDQVISDLSRDEALEQAKSKAIEKAAKNGAIRETVEIVEASDIPVSYLPGKEHRSVFNPFLTV